MPEYPLHTGSIRYRGRNKPIVRSEVVDVVKSAFTFVGQVVGVILALYGYYKWRQLLRFTKYFRQVIRLNLVAKGLKADPNLPADREERVRYLDQKLTHLQRQAVTDFCDNYFRGEAIVHNLLALLAETGRYIRNADPPAASEPRPAVPEPASGST